MLDVQVMECEHQSSSYYEPNLPLPTPTAFESIKK